MTKGMNKKGKNKTAVKAGQKWVTPSGAELTVTATGPDYCAVTFEDNSKCLIKKEEFSTFRFSWSN
jgi:preprotein translocase subunit YajC